MLFGKLHLPAFPAPPQLAAIDILDRRKEPRFPSNDAVEITVMGLFQRTMTGLLLNLSPSGMLIRFERPLSGGTCIYLTIGDELIYGQIQRCVQVADGWHAGILIRYGIRPVSAIA